MPRLTEEIKREIGQHFVFGFHGHEVSDDVAALIRDYYVGNIIIMKRNVQSIPQLHGLIQKLQILCKDSGHLQPLLIGIDQENGLVSAFSSTAKTEAGTQFPGAMALAATSSVDMAEQVSAATGFEMQMTGINWAYSPVADVNSDYRNPVIGVRSFGDDPVEVGKFAAAVARGLTSAGIAPSAKHFPGHGDTHVDSHLSLPRIMKSKDELLATELTPFQALIAQDIATIMTGHMALPLVTGDDTPCSLSRTITTDLLRGELGFDGVVVTDCLEMEAVIASHGAAAGAVQALQAGADVVMICHRIDRQRAALEAVYAAVEAGSVSVASLEESGARIQALKARFTGTWDRVVSGDLDRAHLENLQRSNALLSTSAYAASVAWIRRGDAFRPVSRDGAVLVFTPRMESVNLAVDDADGLVSGSDGKLRNTAGPSYLAFAASVAKRAHSSQHIVYSPKDAISEDIKQAIGSATAVIFTSRNADRSVWQVDYLKKLLAASKGETALHITLVASCAPYDLINAKNIDLPCLATFEFTPSALEAAVAVIFGESEAIGRSPVFQGTS